MTQAARIPWCEPKLIILVRGRREEAVLAACKLAKSGGGTQSMDSLCEANAQVGCPSDCQNSQATS